jgi:dihydrofolate reductase
MEYVARVPAPPLDLFIDDIYCLTGAPRYRRMNVPPMPSAHLFVNLGGHARLWDSDPSVPPAVVTDGWFMGVWTRRFLLEYPTWTRLVGVHFKPWGMSPFSGIPAAELRDRWAPADDVWQRSLDRIRNRVGEAASATGALLALEEELRQYVRPMWKGIGTIVMGRHLFDLVNGWEGQPPAGDHMVVVSHRPKPEGWHPEASYHFVDNVTAAIDKARELAGERDVAVNAGDVGGQIFAAGLVDEVAMDVVPVVFGSGKRYFGRVGGQHVLEDPHVVIQGERVLPLRLKVCR